MTDDQQAEAVVAGLRGLMLGDKVALKDESKRHTGTVERVTDKFVRVRWELGNTLGWLPWREDAMNSAYNLVIVHDR